MVQHGCVHPCREQIRQRRAAIRLRQPGMKVWDIGLFKEFPVREGRRFQFRWEAFNLWNTPQFRAPNSQLGAAGLRSDHIYLAR